MLRPGGRFLCLEFSKVVLPVLGQLYDAYSFNVVPLLGRYVASDEASYRYLVESIRRFPDQAAFAGLMREAGLEQVRWRNLSGGDRGDPLRLAPVSVRRPPAALMLRELRNGARVIATARCLARHNALFPLDAAAGARGAALGWPSASPTARAQGRPGERLARALQELGPAFIKLGQSLAVRGDLLGEAIARDLSELQDRLPSFPSAAGQGAWSRPSWSGRWPSCSPRSRTEPVAAASIAQVHFAVTPEGEEVAVKILRPGIEAAIERDLDFLLWLAEWAERLRPALRRYRPGRYGAHAGDHHAPRDGPAAGGGGRRRVPRRTAPRTRASRCRGSTGAAPASAWSPSSGSSGLPADEREALIAHGHDPDAILAQAAVVFFNQVFRDGFFHADMHPGNMLIDADGRIVALDFGIMGRHRPRHAPASGRDPGGLSRAATTRGSRPCSSRAGFVPAAPGPGGVPAGLPRRSASRSWTCRSTRSRSAACSASC